LKIDFISERTQLYNERENLNKRGMKGRLFFLCFIFILSAKMEAQVTIGQLSKPKEASLLELRETEDKIDYSNATRGLLLPRVVLSDVNELYPMMDATTPNHADYLANKATYKKNHIGMIVYNLGTANGLSPGIYIWDGLKWVKVEIND